MSRTLKDLKISKEQMSHKKEDPFNHKYQKAKRDGFEGNDEEDICPDCGGLINFTDGFLICTECSWSTFETEELNFDQFNLPEAV